MKGSAIFFLLPTLSVAAKKAWGESCSIDSDCLSSYKCFGGYCYWGSQYTGTCSNNLDCFTGYCGPDPTIANPAPLICGVGCQVDSQCEPGARCSQGYCLSGGTLVMIITISNTYAPFFE